MSNVIVALLLSLSIWQFAYNPKAEKVLAYDFMARCRQWDSIPTGCHALVGTWAQCFGRSA